MYNKMRAFDDHKATRVLLLHGCWHTKEGTITRCFNEASMAQWLCHWPCKLGSQDRSQAFPVCRMRL